MIRDIIAQEISTKPDCIQFAKDRKYEEAWIFKSSEEQPGVEEIEKYLSDGYKTLIVEFVWNSDVPEKQFVLTVFNDDHKHVSDFAFIEISFSLLNHYTTFKKFLEDFDESIIGKQYLLTHPVDAVKMSIFNYWLSSVPIDVWDNKEKLDKTLVEKRILERIDITKTDLNFQGLLFMFNKDYTNAGPYYGLKTPCCHKVGINWEVDIKLVIYWMERLISSDDVH